jgi:hypothetical protein
MSLPRDSEGRADSKALADHCEALEHRIHSLETAVAYLQRMESERQAVLNRVPPVTTVSEIQERVGP